jgi:hypothetical protein
MKALPTIRTIGVLIAITPIIVLVTDTFLKFEAFRNKDLATPFFITIGAGLALAIIAQKNMPAKDAYEFERPQK